ncbi:MAG: hypothetical protein QG656_1663, partial [Candidatus Hydrogenedentes bacterium]|nr:hypothetical protein [Candidatus Hydrogenedentota bacterium]
MCVLLAAGLALPVCAQGQTPTRPGVQTDPRELIQSLSGDEQTANPPGARKPGESLFRKESSRLRPASKTDEAKDENADKPTVPDGKAGDTEVKTDGKAAPGEPGKDAKDFKEKPPAPGGDKQSSKSGASTVQGKGAKPSVRTSGGGEGVSVSVKGDAAFEPILQKEVEYGEVPDVGEPLTMDAGSMPMVDFLQSLYDSTGWNILVTEAAQAVTLQFWVTEVTPKTALEVLKFNNVYYDFNDETQYLYVMTKDEHLEREFGNIQATEFNIEHVDVAYIEGVLGSLLST